jgi:hypothetical protein
MASHSHLPLCEKTTFWRENKILAGKHDFGGKPRSWRENGINSLLWGKNLAGKRCSFITVEQNSGGEKDVNIAYILETIQRFLHLCLVSGVLVQTT